MSSTHKFLDYFYGFIISDDYHSRLFLPSACHRQTDLSDTQSLCRSLSLRDHIIHHPCRDIDAGGSDAVAEFHGVVDFIDREPIRCFEDIDRQ